MRINRITATNFRSLGENVVVDLGNLTVLVGPNGSGKSNVVGVLQFVADSMRNGLNGAISLRQGIDRVRRWSRGHPFNMSVRIDLEDGERGGWFAFGLGGDAANEYKVRFESAAIYERARPVESKQEYLIQDGVWIKGPSDLRPAIDRLSLLLPLIAGDTRFGPVAEALRAMAVYSIFPDVLRRPQSYDPAKPMDRHGANWLSVLKDRPRESWAADLCAALGKLTGDIEDARVTTASEYLVIEFLHSTNGNAKNRSKPKWFSASQESDGTLRVAGMLSALRQDPPLTVVGIEEPELTVHPGAIGLIVDHIQEATKSSQVIVTTHSPELLEHVRAEEVRVVERRDGVTTVQPMAEVQKELVQRGLLTLGEVLRTEGLKQHSFV
jgi:predicted ATPase